jgi:glycosyltransferase involved in cell wall biosynthesis
METVRPLRLLILSPIVPYPTHDGWATSIFNVLATLRSNGHDVRLIAVSHSNNAGLAEMQKICPTRAFPHRKHSRAVQVVANFGDPIPYSVSRYFHREVLAEAVETIRRDEIDVVLIEDIAMAPYGPLLREATGVLYYIRTHNILTQLLRRYEESQTYAPMRLVGAWQRRKVERYEGVALAEADGFSVLSESDGRDVVATFPKLASGMDIVGNGTDLNRYHVSDATRDPNVIMHMGTLTAMTKQEAMEWFCREVLPRIRNDWPDARLELAGFAPKGVFERYDGVDAIGRVDDERPYLARGRVFVAPQFVGSGVRLKILNAMATGNAIVCTTVACEGIPLVDGEHALICDDPAGFAAAVSRLLADGGLGEELGRNARALIEREFSWPAIVPKLEERLEQLAMARG